jgi:hypothetical protein
MNKKQRKKLDESLGALIKTRFRIAEEAVQPFHTRCLRCLDLVRGQVDDAEEQLDALDVVMNITAPIVRNVHAQIETILDPILEQPFVLKTSPVSVLPDSVQAELQAALQDSVEMLYQMTGGDETQLDAVLDNITQTTVKYYNEQAEQAAANLYPVVLQALQQAGFKGEFSDWLLNFVVYPLAVFKAPVNEVTSVKRWNGETLVFEQEVVQKCYNISPLDIFPAPYAKTLQDCDYVIERQRFTSSELLDMASTEGFDAEAILLTLEDLPGYKLQYMSTGTDHTPEQEDVSTLDDESDPSGLYDVLVHYGKVRGSVLAEFGVWVEEPLRMYEAEVWLLAEHVIKAVLNADPVGRRPFYTASLYHTPGELWGSCVPEALEDVQIQCTTAGRALVRNMEFSSGPIGEVDYKRVVAEKGDDVTEIHPYKMIKTKSDMGLNQGAAYKFQQVPNLSAQLWDIIDRSTSMAYELIGIPRVAFGQMQGSATLGRTAGGMSIALNQANKGFRHPLLYAEARVIEPVIQRFVDFEMMYNPDAALKGDVNVRASGVRGLQEKEHNQENLTWVLQSLAPFAGGFAVPPAYLMRVLEQLLSTMGVSTKGLPDFAVSDEVNRSQGVLEQLTGASGAGQAASDGTPATGDNPTAGLDGRSATAVNAINESNEAF